jgi:hypothetical protein
MFWNRITGPSNAGCEGRSTAPLHSRSVRYDELNLRLSTPTFSSTTKLQHIQSPYYSWGILASAGGYVFGNTGTDYDLKNVGVATGGAVKDYRASSL